MRLIIASSFVLSSLGACAETDGVVIELAPEVISSIDGSLSVRAIAFAERDPMAEQRVSLTVDYKDRHGTAHPVAPIAGVTDDAGAFEAVFTGLTWDGVGTVTAAIDGTQLTSTATFAVLDRTPPAVAITPPASNQVRIGNDVRIDVHVRDEIGVSQVYFETTDGNRDRATVVASGSTDTTVSFNFRVENTLVGSTITLYALAADLSGNQAAASPIMITVVQ